MAATAAALAGLLTTNADINYYTQQSIFWNNKYEANLAKLEIQQKHETNWENAYDDAMDPDKEIKRGKNNDVVIKAKGVVMSDKAARNYANDKVKEYNAELMMELADKDIEYDTMKAMYDTMLETLRAKQESQKTLTSTSAQDTGLLQS